MLSLWFDVTFDTWFRVGAAYPVDGLDDAVDHDDPLPAEHLRGLMRAEAEWLVGLRAVPRSALEDAFGTTKKGGAWAWSSAAPAPAWSYSVRHRVAIDPDSHSALRDHLVSGEVAHAPRATFGVNYLLAGEPPEPQVAVLCLAAASVHHVGSWRRRGLGTVQVQPRLPARWPSLAHVLAAAAEPTAAS